MTFITQFLGSFYSAAAYADMRYKRRGLGLFYSFILTALTATLAAIYAMAMLNTTLFAATPGKKPLFDDMIGQIVTQWPEMTITEGKITAVDAKQPYYITLESLIFGTSVKGALLTIDTTGNTTYENMRTPLLLTQKDMIARSEEGIKIHPLANFLALGKPPLILNHDKIEKLGTHIIVWTHDHAAKLLLVVGLALWILLTLMLYLLRIAMLIILGVVGLVAASTAKSPIDYATAMRIAALAYTPVGIADAATLVISGHGLPTLLLIALGGLVVITAIYATKAEAA